MVNIKDVARREAPVDMSMKDLTVPRTEGSRAVCRFCVSMSRTLTRLPSPNGLIAAGIDVEYMNAPTLSEFPHLKDTS
jgi:hypothetical protein